MYFLKSILAIFIFCVVFAIGHTVMYFIVNFFNGFATEGIVGILLPFFAQMLASFGAVGLGGATVKLLFKVSFGKIIPIVFTVLMVIAVASSLAGYFFGADMMIELPLAFGGIVAIFSVWHFRNQYG